MDEYLRQRQATAPDTDSSDVPLSLESYGKAEGDQAVAVLRPFLLEWETATPEACLDYLRRHGFERLDLSDAEELMREADRLNFYGDAEAARGEWARNAPYGHPHAPMGIYP